MEYRVVFCWEGAKEPSKAAGRRLEILLNYLAQEGWRVVCAKGDAYLICERGDQVLTQLEARKTTPFTEEELREIGKSIEGCMK